MRKFKDYLVESSKFQHTEKYDQILSLFLNKVPDYEIYNEYFSDEDGHLALQYFINSNIKEEFNWMTGLSILESVENMIKDAIENGNIK